MPNPRSYKRGCQEKIGHNQLGARKISGIQPNCLNVYGLGEWSCSGLLSWSTSLARATATLSIPVVRFVFPDGAIRSWKLASNLGGKVANHGPIGDLEPIAFFGCPRRHRVFVETRCPRHAGLTEWLDTSPRTERLKNPTATPSVILGWSRLSARDAQAACCFRCPASKRSPFFQTAKVIAAILRASVRRAIEGCMPLAISAV
jgi:hypothetical protein